MRRSMTNNPAGLLFAACLTGLFLSACSDDSDHTWERHITVTSYNAGLALNFVPYTNERLAANQDLLDGYDGDVICFQEVWLDDQVEKIKQSVVQQLPYIYTVPPEQVFTEDAACTTDEVGDLADCATDFCPGLSGTGLVSCALAQCGELFTGLSPSCADGVTASVGIPDITVEQLIDNVTRPAGKFTYGGSLGVILASRYPLQNREFQDFSDDSSTIRRGALYADIEVGGRSLLVGCTHLTAIFSDVPYPPSGKYGSWVGENRFMQEQLVSFANRKARGRPILFAGDFNCGMANPGNGVDPEYPENCRVWLNDGFDDPVGEQLPCTFCNDENLVLALGDGSGNTVIDHIYVKNLGARSTFRAQRVFDNPVAIEATIPPSELQPEDSPIMMHPSDHFAVELDIEPR